MCGIAAAFDFRGPAVPLDLDCLEHRGPDARGEWTSPDGCLWLGHTRLSILDLSPNGAQPMHDPETGNVIVFNGEVYNHLKLREEMRDAGVQWRGTSDTETVLAAYRFWGDGMAVRLRGMFAFVIYDGKHNRIFASRDPFGIKPLYYARRGGAIRIVSEVKALPGTGLRKCSRNGLSSYLQWGACPDNEFLFEGIEMLPAGSSMFAEANGNVQIQRFWPATCFPAVSPDDAVKRVRNLIEESVRQHLLSDVPIGCFLSGGIDSSIITAIAARQMGPGELRTFSIGFPQANFDETSVAAEVAERYGTEHHRFEVSNEEALALVQEAVGKMDVPSTDAINTYIISKKVANHGIKVALTGIGGDELFGGYPSFRDAQKLRLISALPQTLRKWLGCLGTFGARLADVPNGDVMSLAIWRRRLWSDQMLTEAGLPLTPLRLETPPELCDSFAQISWAEMGVYMRHMLLRDCDQMSMAVSLELRVPFLDCELAEYVLSLPERAKKARKSPKGLLVGTCRDLLPEHVYNRPKMGFALPMASWMQGPLRDFTEAGLGEVEGMALLAPGTIPKLRNQFQDGKLHWNRIWSLVVLGHYLKRANAAAGFEGESEPPQT